MTDSVCEQIPSITSITTIAPSHIFKAENISDEKLTLKNSIFENMAYISPIIIPPLNTIICIYKILYNCNCI